MGDAREDAMARRESAGPKPRCPACGAMTAGDADWCGLCFAPLRERKAPPSARPPAQPPSQARSPGPPSKGDSGAAYGHATEVASRALPPPPPFPFAVPGPSGPAGLLSQVWEGDSEPAPSGQGPAPTSVSTAEPTTDHPGPSPVGWPCAVCGASNDLSLDACAVCGGSFARLFREHADSPVIEPRQAAFSSLVFPGLGHARAGHGAEGIGRALVFVLLFGAGLLLVLSGSNGGPALMAVGFIGLALALYAVTAVDAYRLAAGVPQLVSARLLLYGTSVLLVLAAVSSFLMAGRPEAP